MGDWFHALYTDNWNYQNGKDPGNWTRITCTEKCNFFTQKSVWKRNRKLQSVSWTIIQINSHVYLSPKAHAAFYWGSSIREQKSSLLPLCINEWNKVWSSDRGGLATGNSSHCLWLWLLTRFLKLFMSPNWLFSYCKLFFFYPGCEDAKCQRKVFLT